jgi:YD repeat-containing protein
VDGGVENRPVVSTPAPPDAGPPPVTVAPPTTSDAGSVDSGVGAVDAGVLAGDGGVDAGALATVTPVEDCTARWLLDGGAYDAGVIAEAEALADAGPVSAESDVTSGCLIETATTTDRLDAEGRIVEHTELFPDGGIKYRATQTFDGGALVLFTEWPVDHRVEWIYDEAGHLTSKRESYGDATPTVTDWTWSDSRLLARMNADGRSSTWTYDDAGSLTRVDELNASGDCLGSHQYAFDDEGRVASIILYVPCDSFALDTRSFGYWPSGVLAEEKDQWNHGGGGDSDTKYDEQGRLVSASSDSLDSEGSEWIFQDSYLYADAAAWTNHRWGIDSPGERREGESRVFSPSDDLTLVANTEVTTPWSTPVPAQRGWVDLRITRAGRLALEQTDTDEDCVPNQRHALYRDDAGVLRLERFWPPSPIAERTFKGPACPAFPGGFGGWHGPDAPAEP